MKMSFLAALIAAAALPVAAQTATSGTAAPQGKVQVVEQPAQAQGQAVKKDAAKAKKKKVARKTVKQKPADKKASRAG